MKRTLALLLAALMLLTLLSGCGSKANPDADPDSSPSLDTSTPVVSGGDEQKKVLFCTVSLEGGLSIFDELLRPAIESYGYAYDCISCDGDALKQIEQVENGVIQGYDLIFLYAVTGEALADACARAMDDGVYIYTFLNDTTYHDVLFCDDPVGNGHLIGEMSLQWVEETFPDAAEGSINAAILGCSNDSYNVQLSDAVREIIHADPRINVLEDYDVEYSTTAAQAAAENVMTMHPDTQIQLWVSIAAIMIDGIDAAVMAENSGVEDVSKVGAIYPAPLSQDAVDKITLGKDNKSIIRGIMCTGGDLAVNFQNMAAECDALLRGESAEPFHYSPIEAVWFEDLAAYGY